MTSLRAELQRQLNAWVCRSSAERSKIPRLSRQIRDLQKNHVVMRLRHVAEEMEDGQRKVMKLISVTSFSQRVFDQRNLFAAAVSEVPVIGPYQVLGSPHIDMHSVYWALRYFVWVDLNRIFVASLRFCGEPRCFDPTTEAQRNRGYNLCRTSPT